MTGPEIGPGKVLGEKDFIIRYPLPSNPIINVQKKKNHRGWMKITHTLSPDPFNHVYARTHKFILYIIILIEVVVVAEKNNKKIPKSL